MIPRILLYLLIFTVFSWNNIIWSQTEQNAITGIWLTPENRSAIKIYKKGDRYYGKIIWEKEPNDENGTAKKDIHNPDPKLRNRPLHGIVIITNLCYNENNEWIKGKIYNPESGNTYKIKAELINNNTLKIRGYVGVSLIGKSSVWKRKQ